MAKYRVLVHTDVNYFIPQVWHWWFPIWHALIYGSTTGYDYGAIGYNTAHQAWDAIHTVRGYIGRSKPVYQYSRPCIKND